jgi:hypothetical protein
MILHSFLSLYYSDSTDPPSSLKFGKELLEYAENSQKSAWTGIIKMPKDSPDPEMVKIMRICV